MKAAVSKTHHPHLLLLLPYNYKNPSLSKPIKTLINPSSSSSSPSIPPLRSATQNPNTHQHQQQQQQQQQHKDLLVETFHYNNNLKDLIDDISRRGSDPVRLFQRDGDWTKAQFWAAIVFLLEDERITEALQVFDLWKNKETSRISEANYSRIIRLLCEQNLLAEAVTIFHDMEKYGLVASLAMYNDIIHGFARKKEFDKSRETISKMVETGMQPSPETYNGLIRAYGNYRLYDEMSKCVKKMKSEGCSPNEVTYNLLIGEFARGGLLEKMEGVHRTLLSKGMNLQPNTLVTMLEAYANLGVLEKMEKVYRRVLHSKAYMKENVLRKLAIVYIDNCRFARLEEFGNEICSRTGRTDLMWCILLLACACLLSRKGIDSIVKEMNAAKIGFNTTFTNVLGLFYLKIKDFKGLDGALSLLETHNLQPDMVTFGILFDACEIGYSGTGVLEVWRRNGYFEEAVAMNTDPLVLAALGKGHFIRKCEKVFSSLTSEAKKKQMWTYGTLISLVFGRGKGGRGHLLEK